MFSYLGRIHAQMPIVIVGLGFIITVLMAIGNGDHHIKTQINDLWVASDSRVGKELEWVDKADKIPASTAAGRHDANLMLSRNSDDSSALTKKTLLAHVKSLDIFQDTTVSYPVKADGDKIAAGSKQSYDNPQIYRWSDLCRNPAPFVMQCLRVTVLDCFKQGSRDYPLVTHSNYLGLKVDTVVASAVMSTKANSAATAGALIQTLDALPAAQKQAMIPGYNSSLTSAFVVTNNMIPAVVQDTLLQGAVKTSVVAAVVADIIDNYHWKHQLLTMMHFETLAAAQIGAAVANATANNMKAGLNQAIATGKAIAYVQKTMGKDAQTPGSAFFIATSAQAGVAASKSAADSATLKNTLTAYVDKNSAKSGMGVDIYSLRALMKPGEVPDLNKLSDAEIQAKVQANKCFFWDGGQTFPRVDLGLTAGPRERFWSATQATLSKDITKITGLELVAQHLFPKYFANRMAGKEDFDSAQPSATAAYRPGGLPNPPPNVDEAEAIILKFNRQLEKNTREASKLTEKSDGVWHGFYGSTSLADALDRQNKADAGGYIVGYVLVLVYAMLQFFSMNFVQSRAVVGLASFLTVGMGVAGGLGLGSFFGISLNIASIAVLPFVLLGIGVDDAFVMCYNFPVGSQEPLAEVMSKFMAEIGPSVTLTSITNVAVFLIASLIPIPLVSDFSLMAAVVMFYIWLLAVFVFPSVLALDEMRRRGNRFDLICCLTSKQAGSEPNKQSMISNFVEKLYVPFVTHPGGVVASFALCIILIAVSASGIKDVEKDLQVIDVLKSSDPLRPAVEERFKKFGVYPWSITARNVDLRTPEMQMRFLAAYERVQQNVPYVPKTNQHPFHLFYQWSTPESVCNLTDPARSGCSNSRCNADDTFSGGRCGPLYGCNFGFYPAPEGVGLTHNKSKVFTPLCMTKAALKGTADAVKTGVMRTLGERKILEMGLTANHSLAFKMFKAGISNHLAGGLNTSKMEVVLDMMMNDHGLTAQLKTKLLDAFKARFVDPVYATDDKMYCPAIPKEEVLSAGVPLNMATQKLHDSQTSPTLGFETCWQLWHEKDRFAKDYGGSPLVKADRDASTSFPTFYVSSKDAVWKR
jgi:hypothetical protein